MKRLAAFVAASLFASVARADFTNNEAIREHVDAEMARLASAPVDDSARHSLLASRLTLSIASLVPVLGSYLLDTKVYGEIRPAAILFDWILGGLIPASLAVAALALNGETRAVLGWTALGIYGATRVGVIVVGNLHIGEYNRLVQLRLGMTAQAPIGRNGPALLAVADW
jgi:hypothetical protein